MLKIKPCAYCGSKPRLWQCKRKGSFGRWITMYGIGCTNMDCREFIPRDARLSELHNYTIIYRLLKDVLAGWNRRYIEKGGK